MIPQKQKFNIMIIKLEGSIKSEEEKQIDLLWYGIDSGMSFKSLDDALAAKKDDDKEILLKIHCNGGDVIEGYAMYDKLRSMEGCTIKAEVEGECSSMATVVLLAASERKAYRDARICIHKPRIQAYFNDCVTEDEARKLYDDLHAETDRMLTIYVDRTGQSAETLEALMKEDKYITVEEAKDLGFITEIIEHVTAQKTAPNSNKPNLIKMAKEEKKEPTKAQKLLISLAETFGLKAEVADVNDPNKLVSMTLNTADGGTITIDREEGDPQVGDTASPDGEFVMPDGKTIVITDGVITEIREDEAGEGDDNDGEGDDEESEALKQAKAELETANARIAELESQLAEAKKNEKTSAEMEILNLVAIAGGTEWLKQAKSNYKAPARKEDQKPVSESGSEVARMLAEMKNNKKD